MPISADRFDAIDDEEPSPGTNAHAVLSFLSANPEQAFTQGEIAEATDVALGSVGPTLVRLRDDGRVDHRGHYWRASDHVRSVDGATAHASETAASHEDRSFDQEDWAANATDPRDDRE